MTPAEPYAPRHESYVDLFGLGDGTVAGGDVVFDSVYPWPRREVEDALLAQGPLGAASMTAEDVPGGCRIRLVVPEPADPDAALRCACGVIDWPSVAKLGTR